MMPRSIQAPEVLIDGSRDGKVVDGDDREPGLGRSASEIQ